MLCTALDPAEAKAAPASAAAPATARTSFSVDAHASKPLVPAARAPCDRSRARDSSPSRNDASKAVLAPIDWAPPMPRSLCVTVSASGISWASAARSSGAACSCDRRVTRVELDGADQMAPSVASVTPPRTAAASAAKMGSLPTTVMPVTARNGPRALSHCACSSARCTADRHSRSRRSYSADRAWNRSTASSASFESGWHLAASTRNFRRSEASSVADDRAFHSSTLGPPRALPGGAATEPVSADSATEARRLGRGISIGRTGARGWSSAAQAQQIASDHMAADVRTFAPVGPR
eukprot:scaffold536_cov98-Isochrysis_galbana.AAC.7